MSALRSVCCSSPPLWWRPGVRTNRSPFEPPAVEEAAPPAEPTAGPLEDLAYWADGYLLAARQAPPRSYQPATPRTRSIGSGGAMTVTKVAGTTGRYVARFAGLSALLGTKQHGARDRRPATTPPTASRSAAALVPRLGRGAVLPDGHRGEPTNAQFTLLVTRDYADRAFAYAHQPTVRQLARPAAAGSWNPRRVSTDQRGSGPASTRWPSTASALGSPPTSAATCR